MQSTIATNCINLANHFAQIIESAKNHRKGAGLKTVSSLSHKTFEGGRIWSPSFNERQIHAAVSHMVRRGLLLHFYRNRKR